MMKKETILLIRWRNCIFTPRGLYSPPIQNLNSIVVGNISAYTILYLSYKVHDIIIKLESIWFCLELTWKKTCIFSSLSFICYLYRLLIKNLLLCLILIQLKGPMWAPQYCIVMLNKQISDWSRALVFQINVGNTNAHLCTGTETPGTKSWSCS